MREKIRDAQPAQPLEDELDEDYEALDETAEEWPEDSEVEPLSAEDRAAIQQEVDDLDGFTRLALSIEQNAKGKALLVALDRHSGGTNLSTISWANCGFRTRRRSQRERRCARV